MIRIPSFHVVGDSHTEVFNNCDLFQVHHIGPATAFNLNKPNNTTRSFEKLFSIVNNLRKGDIVILVFGEIDCRIHIYYQYKKNNEEISLPDLIDATIDHYFDVIQKLQKGGLFICVYGIPPVGTQENMYHYPYYASRNERSLIYSEFNQKMKNRCIILGLPYIDIHSATSDSNGFILPIYTADEVHLNKNVLPIVEKELIKEYGLAVRLRLCINKISRSQLMSSGTPETSFESDYFPINEPKNPEMLKNEIVMGDSDQGALGNGWYVLEDLPPKIRWTKKTASAFLKVNNGLKLCIKLITFCEAISVTIYANEHKIEHIITPSEWNTLEIPLNGADIRPILKVVIDVAHTWVPDEILKNGDKRQLGVAVEKIWLE